MFTVKPVSSCSSQKGSAALGVSWGTAATKKLTTGDFSILVLLNSSQTVAITGIASLLLTICFVLESKKLNIQLQTKSCLFVGYPSSRQLSQSKGQSIVSMRMIRRNRFYCCAVFLWWWGWRQWWWWEKQILLLSHVLMFHACRPTDNMSCVFIQHIFCTDIRKLKIRMFVNLTKYLTDCVYESKPKDIFIAW